MGRAAIDINPELLDAARSVAEEQGRDERELVEDAVGFYLLAVLGRSIGDFSDRGSDSDLRSRAAQRIREAAGSGRLGQDEARVLALSLVREAREEAPTPEDTRSPLSPEEARESMEVRRVRRNKAAE